MRSVQISSDRTKPVTADIRDFGLPHAGGGKIAGGWFTSAGHERSLSKTRPGVPYIAPKASFLQAVSCRLLYSVSSGVLSFKFNSQC